MLKSESKNISNFSFKETWISVILNRIRVGIFTILTKNGSSLFLRGKDAISARPQVNGLHEPALTHFIAHLSATGYADYFIDIGANIGLTSCQNGNNFKVIHMFEPNPLCCKILEVNCQIALPNKTYVLHEVGLGDQNKELILKVPINNWGGAFISDKSNSYNEETLAGKDGFNSLTQKNYFDLSIKIRDTAQELQLIFTELAISNLTCGVIKIDVEGFELTVLKGIAKSIPTNFKAVIIFESLSSNFKMQEVLNAFGSRMKHFKLIRQTPWRTGWPMILKCFTIILGRPVSTILTNISDDNWQGDLVLEVDELR